MIGVVILSYQVHNFQTGETIEAAPFNEMDTQIQLNEQNIGGKIDSNTKGAANGVAGLDANAHVPKTQLNVATVNETQQIITDYSVSGT